MSVLRVEDDAARWKVRNVEFSICGTEQEERKKRRRLSMASSSLEEEVRMP